MNETINKFLLAGDKFMSEMHLSSQLRLVNQDLRIVPVDLLLKIKKEYKNLKKQEIHDIFIKTNYIKFAFNMTWYKEILNI